jgi:hypothetical protein
MTAWSRQHGQLDRVSYTMKCDHSGCTSAINPPDSPSFDDLGQRASTRAFAEHNGWYIALDRSSPDQSRDLCPLHAPNRNHR